LGTRNERKGERMGPANFKIPPGRREKKEIKMIGEAGTSPINTRSPARERQDVRRKRAFTS